jgi:hypothetical protein
MKPGPASNRTFVTQSAVSNHGVGRVAADL